MGKHKPRNPAAQAVIDRVLHSSDILPEHFASQLPPTVPLEGRRGRAAKTKSPRVQITFDVVIAIVLFLIQQGYSMSGLPSAIEGSVVCWLISAVLLVHVVWIGLKIRPVWRLTVATVMVVVAVSVLWTPVRSQYMKEHSAGGAVAKGSSGGQTNPAAGRRFVSLKELFETDWPSMPAWYTIWTLQTESPAMPLAEVDVRVNGDFVAKSRFIAAFINEEIEPKIAEAACIRLAVSYRSVIRDADSNVDFLGRAPWDSAPTHFRDMVFTNRFFIYYENPNMSLEQKGRIESFYRKRGLSIEFRDRQYESMHQENPPEPRSGSLKSGTILLPDAHSVPEGLIIEATRLGTPSAERSRPRLLLSSAARSDRSLIALWVRKLVLAQVEPG